MSPATDVETIRCLLCRGVVCYSSDDDSRYIDHLHVEHRVYYYVSWIIEKTVEENSKNEFGSTSLSLPSITITPISKRTTVNGSTHSDSTHAGSAPRQPAPRPPSAPTDSGQKGPAGSTIFPVSIKEEGPEDDISPAMSIFPINPDYPDINPDYSDYPDDGGEEDEVEGTIGIKEAKIITIRVEGQRVGGKKMYKCSLCPNIKPWPTIHKAERHRITHIPLAFRKMFQCPQCKERFIKEKNVKRHIDSGLCQGPRDHPCTVCGEVYESKFDLQLHEESHEQLLKRHRCHLCGAKFNKIKYLNKHILSHSNRKPYKCDLCGKAFKSEYYVKTHRAAHLHESYESSGTMDNSGLEDFEFEEHLQPQVDLIEGDPGSKDSHQDQETGSC